MSVPSSRSGVHRILKISLISVTPVLSWRCVSSRRPSLWHAGIGCIWRWCIRCQGRLGAARLRSKWRAAIASRRRCNPAVGAERPIPVLSRRLPPMAGRLPVLATKLGTPGAVIWELGIAEKRRQSAGIETLAVIRMSRGEDVEQESNIAVQSRSLVPPLLVQTTASCALKRRRTSSDPLGRVQLLVVNPKGSFRRCSSPHILWTGALLLSHDWRGAIRYRIRLVDRGCCHLLRPHLHSLGDDDGRRHRVKPV